MDKEQLLLEAGLVSKPSLPPASKRDYKYASNEKVIEQKRAELELRKLEIEIEKLNAPNTSIDYFKEMLSLQQQHFNQLLTMQKEQGNLMLEIEKLKFGGESDDSMLYLLDLVKPILPQILAKTNITKGEEKPKMNKEEYVKAMQDGKISPAQGWEDFKMEFPELAANMTFEQFIVQFNKIKTEGLPKV